MQVYKGTSSGPEHKPGALCGAPGMSLPSAEPCSREEPPAAEDAAVSPPDPGPGPAPGPDPAGPAPPPAPPGAVRGAGPAGPRSPGPERRSEPAAGAMPEDDRELRVRFIEPDEAEPGPGPGGGRWSCGSCGRCAEGAALRWCITGVLCASFLGLVSERAGGGGPGAAGTLPRAGE